MLPLISHVGLSKAASSFLQRTIFPKHRDICYLGKNSGDQALNSAGSALTMDNSHLYDQSSVSEAFRGKIANGSGSAALYSDENLSASKFVDVRTMIQRIEAVDSNCRFLLITRNQIDWLQSLYFFYLRIAEREVMEGFDAWITEQLLCAGRVGCSISQIWLDTLVRSFEGAAGPERVTIVPFEILQTAPLDFCDRLSAALRIDAAETRNLYTAAEPMPSDKPRINKPTADFLLLLRHLIAGDRQSFISGVQGWASILKPRNARQAEFLTQASHAIRDGLWDYGAWALLFQRVARIIETTIPGPPAQAHMSTEMQLQIEQLVSEQNDAVSARYGLDLRRLGYPTTDGNLRGSRSDVQAGFVRTT